MDRPNAAYGKFYSRFSPKREAFLNEGSEGQRKILGALICTIQHFFGDFNSLFSRVSDPRSRNKVVYPLGSLGFAGVLMYLCHLKSRRQMRLLMRTLASEQTFKTVFGVDGFPHGDTLNDAFCQIDPEQVQEVVCFMVETLIRKKVLYKYRVLDTCFVIAVDGTGTITYPRRHCPHCLTQKRNGKTIYYHQVLEAKLVTPNGFAFSLMTEFIENPGEAVDKQDCELKAFYRLARRIKTRFPRLPVLMTGDGLYACGPVFQICKDYAWKFMIVLKDKDLPSVNEEFAALRPLQRANHLTVRTGKRGEIKQDYSWVNSIRYTDSEKRDHVVDVIECLEVKPDKHGEPAQSKWKWITNCNVDESNVAALSNDAGRNRWKVENEGFNVQKNGGYELEHGYTTDANAAKIFYYLLQIAHMLAQLLHKGSLLGKKGRKALGSAKNLAFWILEAWRNAPFLKRDQRALSTLPLQIRFCPDTS